MKAIAMPVNDRPHYLQATLSAIRRAVGHEDWTIIFSAEPGCPAVRELCKSVDWMPSYYLEHPIRLGCEGNIFAANLQAYQAGAEFIMHLEDDIVISPDALLLADWFQRNQIIDKSVLCLRRIQEDRLRPHVLQHAHDGLISIGFAYDARLWTNYIRGYWLYYTAEQPGIGADLQMAWNLGAHGFTQYRPLVNRSMHIGIIGTNTGEDYYNPVVCDPCFQGIIKDFSYG